MQFSCSILQLLHSSESNSRRWQLLCLSYDPKKPELPPTRLGFGALGSALLHRDSIEALTKISDLNPLVEHSSELTVTFLRLADAAKNNEAATSSRRLYASGQDRGMVALGRPDTAVTRDEPARVVSAPTLYLQFYRCTYKECYDSHRWVTLNDMAVS